MKKYKFTIIGLIISGICFAIYNIIGVEVLEDGTLVESFGFLAIGSLVLFITAIYTVIKLIKILLKKKA